MAAFAFARNEFRGRELFLQPSWRDGDSTSRGDDSALPHDGCWLINTHGALIIPWFVMPLRHFCFRQYILSLPRDGGCCSCGWCASGGVLFVSFCRSLLALTVLALYVFLATWNSFLFPFLC